MPVYTVHAPKSLGHDFRAAPEKVVFVRDGFHVWAFLLGFIWLIYRRLWLVLLGYVVVQLAAEIMLWLTHASGFAHAVTMLVIALFVGSEAGALRRWTLSRRKWQQIGLIAADDEEAAERRFFERATPDNFAFPSRTSSAIPMPHSSIAARDAAGFFPMPDGSR
jgi:hypothetical protein